jgi:hypothetical protein
MSCAYLLLSVTKLICPGANTTGRANALLRTVIDSEVRNRPGDSTAVPHRISRTSRSSIVRRRSTNVMEVSRVGSRCGMPVRT